MYRRAHIHIHTHTHSDSQTRTHFLGQITPFSVVDAPKMKKQQQQRQTNSYLTSRCALVSPCLPFSPFALPAYSPLLSLLPLRGTTFADVFGRDAGGGTNYAGCLKDGDIEKQASSSEALKRRVLPLPFCRCSCCMSSVSQLVRRGHVRVRACVPRFVR